MVKKINVNFRNLITDEYDENTPYIDISKNYQKYFHYPILAAPPVALPVALGGVRGGWKKFVGDDNRPPGWAAYRLPLYLPLDK